MSGESVIVRRRSRAEIARLASLYGASGLSRSEFCRRHDLALSTLNRYLKKQPQPQAHRSDDGVGRSPLVEVSLAAAVVPTLSEDRHRVLTVLLSNGRRVEVGDDFDDDALRRLVAVLERW
jgi:hypothetical protein